MQSAGEARFGKSLHAEAIHREHAAGAGFLLRNALDRPTHTGEIQDVEIGAAEHYAGQVAHGEFDHAVDASIRRVADDAPAKHVGIPDIALRIDGGTVERASVVAG